MKHLALLICLLAPPAQADVAEAVQQHVLPGFARFAEATAALAAIDDCRSPAITDGFHAAFDAWMAVSHLRMGPTEDEGRALAIAYWPDPKAQGRRTTAQVLQTATVAQVTPGFVADLSVAARGLFGLERMISPDGVVAGEVPCALTLALADDLARLAAEVDSAWRGGFADGLISPGPGSRYLTPAEARQALFTSLITGLEFTADQRIGRPLGSFGDAHPDRAEAHASGRSARNVQVSLRALRDLALTLHADLPKTGAAFDRALAQADTLDLAGVADPQVWLKAEILATSIRAARDAALAELAPALGAGVGFNAADGD